MQCATLHVFLECSKNCDVTDFCHQFRTIWWKAVHLCVIMSVVTAFSAWWMCDSSGRAFVRFIGLVRNLSILGKFKSVLLYNPGVGRVRCSCNSCHKPCCCRCTRDSSPGSPKLCICVQRGLLCELPLVLQFSFWCECLLDDVKFNFTSACISQVNHVGAGCDVSCCMWMCFLKPSKQK